MNTNTEKDKPKKKKKQSKKHFYMIKPYKYFSGRIEKEWRVFPTI